MRRFLLMPYGMPVSINALLLAGTWMAHHGQGLFYFTHNLLGLLLLLTIACSWNTSLLLTALFFKTPSWPGWARRTYIFSWEKLMMEKPKAKWQPTQATASGLGWLLAGLLIAR